MGRANKRDLTVAEQIGELQLLRRHLIFTRKQLFRQNTKLKNECKQLRAEKLAFMKYIKELEGFLNVKDEKIRQELL